MEYNKQHATTVLDALQSTLQKQKLQLNKNTEKQCIDCQSFKTDCGFANVDKKLNLNGNFEACSHFAAKRPEQHK